MNAVDVKSIYEAPLALHEEALDQRIVEHLNIWTGRPKLKDWDRIVEVVNNPKKGNVRVAMVGKYVDLTESYKSLTEALYHGGFANGCKVEIVYVDSEAIERTSVGDVLDTLSNEGGIDAFLIPGGFGERGSEGKISAIKYARENNIPFFGICLGLQMAVIEFARNVAGILDATSREFDDKGTNTVIDLMDSQKAVTEKGGSMRLGAYPCALKKDSLVKKIYDKSEVSERHRHRFEFNNNYREQLEKAGLSLSGLSPDKKLVEIIELPTHPWFIGVQFHPEFKSSPRNPHPLFSSFIEAALKYRDSTKNKQASKSQAAIEETTINGH